ncbi:hypothetical protein [Planktotalea sp.]|uniref:hypothetical protein n=1 Tax=Planktotalea sp. TaxID=2029877 RepID=UPI003296A212
MKVVLPLHTTITTGSTTVPAEPHMHPHASDDSGTSMLIVGLILAGAAVAALVGARRK